MAGFLKPRTVAETRAEGLSTKYGYARRGREAPAALSVLSMPFWRYRSVSVRIHSLPGLILNLKGL